MTDSFAELRAEGRIALQAAGVTGPDAELLLAHAAELDRSTLTLRILHGQAPEPAQAAAYRAAIARRATREPLQHITGRAPFRHLELQVGPGVFVPRPETEVLVDVVLDARPEPALTAIDFGTGSGAIALALATERPGWRVHAVERSASAFAWAARNVEACAPSVDLRHGDLASSFDDLAGQVDVLVSNPPYIPTWAVPIDVEVERYDPAEALYSGEDGLDDVRTLARRGLVLAAPGALLALEHGERQGSDVRAILSDAGWSDARTVPDLTGRDRVTLAWHSGAAAARAAR